MLGWFGNHPVMNTFMQPVKEQLKSLESNGSITFQLLLLYTIHVGLTVLVHGVSVKFKAVLLTGVYDIPAKSEILGTVHHKAKFPCTRCLHPGKIVTTSKGYYLIISILPDSCIGGNVRVFPHTMAEGDEEIVINGCGELRSRDSFLHDITTLAQDPSFTPVK